MIENIDETTAYSFENEIQEIYRPDLSHAERREKEINKFRHPKNAKHKDAFEVILRQIVESGMNSSKAKSIFEIIDGLSNWIEIDDSKRRLKLKLKEVRTFASSHIICFIYTPTF